MNVKKNIMEATDVAYTGLATELGSGACNPGYTDY